MIVGFKFEIHGGPDVAGVEDAAALIRPLLADDVQVAIHRIEYDHVGAYGQSQPTPIGCTIDGHAWRGSDHA